MKNPWDAKVIPAYTATEAANFIGVPMSTLRAWCRGQAGFKRVIVPDGGGNLLSFRNLVEAFALAALRRQHSIPLQKTRRAIDYLQKRLNVDRPLLSPKLRTDGIELYIEALAKQLGGTRDRKSQLLAVSKGGQLGMRAVIEAYLRRIEWDSQGAVVRLFPITRRSGEESVESAPRQVEINPEICFGRPVIAGTRVPVTEIQDRFSAGESIQALAEDFGLAPESIEEAIRWNLVA